MLTVLPACFGNSALAHTIGNQWTPGENGAPSCKPDAFVLAHDMLAEPNVRYVVAGRVVSVEGLPEVLVDADHQFELALAELSERELAVATIEGRPAAGIDAADVEVETRFQVRNVLKPPGRCPHPPRVEEAAQCERADGLPEELTLRIPSDWFLWPATGTSRRVALRAGGRHFAALRELDRKRQAGEIGADEHAEGIRRSESAIYFEMNTVEVKFHERLPEGTRWSVKRFSERRADGTRLLEDRRGHIEVGGEYLLALGPGEEGVARTYYRSPKLQSGGTYDYQVFWGDELREVEIAMMLVGNCMHGNPLRTPREILVYDCRDYARGLATFWLYPELKCRH